MQVSVTRIKDVTVARVDESKLTYPVLGAFSADLRRIVEDGARRLVVDFTGVCYIDSPAIGCLMELHALMGRQGGRFKLAGLQPRVSTLLSMTGLFRVLEAYETAAEAASAFGTTDRKVVAPEPPVPVVAPARALPARFTAMLS
jgi:anti-anti-sigma factor